MRGPRLAPLSVLLATLVAVLSAAMSNSLEGQAVLKADGLIESTEGGFKFPDGSLQTTAATAGPASPGDTGQRSCWNTGGISILCAGTGQDGELQFGLSWPAPRFTALGDGTVLDSLTGLIWLQDANCATETMTWQEALDWVAGFNSGSTSCTDYSAGTFSDWRVPNIRELLSLIDYDQKSPAISSGHPFVDIQSENYWSASTYQISPALAWYVRLDAGLASGSSKKGDRFVWPVRQ